jgi:predicted permease
MGVLPFELLSCFLLGFLLGWSVPWLPGWIAPLLIRWGVPFSLAALLLRSKLSFALLKVGLLGLLVPLVCLALLLSWPPLRQRMADRVLILGAVVGNTGYWGLPVALALLPPEAVATAAIYDVAGTLITWGVGPWVLLGLPGSPLALVSTLVGSPALQGFALFLLISQSPWSTVLSQALWWPARAVFVVALALLGMRLGLTIRARRVVWSGGIPWAMAFKLVVVPVVVGLLSGVVHLTPLDRQALVLQGAAPTALSVLLMAEAKQQGAPLASSLVLSSTVVAMVTVPLWWSLIR